MLAHNRRDIGCRARHASTTRQQSGNPRPDPFRRRLDVPVRDVRVPKGHRGIAVTELRRDNRQGNALDHAPAGVRMPQVVEAYVLDADVPPDPVP